MSDDALYVGSDRADDNDAAIARSDFVAWLRRTLDSLDGRDDDEIVAGIEDPDGNAQTVGQIRGVFRRALTKLVVDESVEP